MISRGSKCKLDLGFALGVRLTLGCLALVLLCLTACSTPEPAEHREVVVDSSQWRANEPGSAPHDTPREAAQEETLPIQTASSSVYFDEAMQSMASQIAESMSAEGKTEVAILDFVSISSKSPGFVGPFISEQLISLLFLTGRFEVIERRFLDTVLAEQDLTVSDLFDDASIKKLGGLLGVDAILVGTYTDMGVELCANGRLISVESGQVFAVAMEQIRKDDRIVALMEAGSEKSADERAASNDPAGTDGTDRTFTGRERPDPLEKYNRADRADSIPGGESLFFRSGGSNRGRKGLGKRPIHGEEPNRGNSKGEPPFRAGTLELRALCFQTRIEEAGDLARGLLDHPRFDEAATSFDWAWISYALTEEAFVKGRDQRPIKREAFERPLELAKRALRCDCNDPVALCAMGQVLFRLGRQRDAMQHFEKVLELNPRADELPPQVKKILPQVARQRPSKKNSARPSD